MVDTSRTTRWVFLIVAAAAMGAAGTYQFVWSSIRPALTTTLSMDEATLGSIFTLYVVCQTLSQFPAGWFRDRFGPRLPLLAGAILVAAGYLGVGYASQNWQVFAAYAVGGVGAGATYTVAVNTPVKWFDDRRGLATGIVTMAYGGLSVLFIPYVRAGIDSDFTGTLQFVAAATGCAVLLGVFVLRDPSADGADDTAPTLDAEDAYSWREAARTRQFWLLYVMLIVVNAVGLMLIGKAVTFAQEFGFAATVVTATASAIAIADSAGLVTIGGLSDRFDRERIVALTVTLSGVVTGLAVVAGGADAGLWFVVLVAVASFLRSPVFAITPALVGEYYGAARSSENYAALYTARIWGGVGGGVAASVLITTIGWSRSFLVGAFAMTAVGLLMTRLRPVKRTG